jgi:putative addiction module killer protein
MKILRYQKEDGTVPLTEWLSALRDLQARIAIRRRLDRFADGNPGNTRALLGGVREMKIDMGPGYRVYYAHHGQTVVLLLCGGDKGTQKADIARAVGYWEDWKTRTGSAT